MVQNHQQSREFELLLHYKFLKWLIDLGADAEVEVSAVKRQAKAQKWLNIIMFVIHCDCV